MNRSKSSEDQQREAVGLPPRRELDAEKTGERAGTPPGLIRRPIKQLPMKPVKR